MNASRFYPKFPLIYSNDLDPYKNVGFNDAIVNKKEFAIERLDKEEQFPTEKGEYLRHQRYIARYMSVYDELLLFHEPGTGKTCTAVAAIENLRNSEDKTITRAVVCAKGEGITKNFLQELIFTCTDGRYIPENFDEMTDQQKNTRLKKSANKFYTFKTFETFAKEIDKSSDSKLRNEYEDTIFILDEVHHLREQTTGREEKEVVEKISVIKKKDQINIYDNFHRLFHVLNRRKIILMSGTPIKDTPDEFASLMNLILPADKQLSVRTFYKDYFSTGTTMAKKKSLADIIRGRVSYLTATTDIQKNYIGETVGKLQHFIVYPDTMSEFQSMAYQKAYSADQKDRTIFVHSRQASLFVFPDSSYGPEGYDKYVKRNAQALINILKTGGIETLRKYSSKYAKFVNHLQSLIIPKKHFVYLQYVTGSGAIVLSKVLEAFGYQKANGDEKTKKRRYALCTRHTMDPKQVQTIINRFNRSDNIDGEYISVIIGSRILNEGFTLKDIDSEWIFTGHWNYAEVAQAIARGWRLGSHNNKIKRGDKDIHVDVYQCVSFPNNNITSIDLELYETAERKDLINRPVERFVKENSFDCALTYDRNLITGYDGKRECDYQSCNYKCDGTIGQMSDTSTFNLLSDIKNQIKSKVKERLDETFRLVDEYALEDLANDIGHDIDAVEEAVSNLIETAALFYDSRLFPKFLRSRGNVLFLSIDPISSPSILSDFYTSRCVMEVSNVDTTFKQLLQDLYEETLPELVKQVFDNSRLTRKLLMELPFRVQRIILQACILSKEVFKTDMNSEVRDSILEFYQGFFEQLRHTDGKIKWTIWLHSDSIGFTCYDPDENAFEPCDFNNVEKIEALKTSPIGWYGLINPITNDFCIRDMSEKEIERREGPGIDLRKITVGKRCINHDKAILLDIMSKRMKIGEGDTDAAREKFWNPKSKKEICSVMKNWFEQNKLIEKNFDCGTSKKSRGKFV